MLYTVAFGDSPATIARRYGVAMASLIAANPQKPTTVVAGQPTWRDLRVGETLRVPVAGFVGAPGRAPLDLHAMSPQALTARGVRRAEGGTFVNRHGVHVDRWGRPIGQARAPQVRARRGAQHPHPHGVHGLGDPATDALNALLAAGDPCDQANVALVCAAQAAMGLGADGKWGSGSSSAATALGVPAPAGCSPRPSWWAPTGQVNCPSGSTPAPTPPAPSSDVDATAAAALAALTADSNYCTSVKSSGTAVNTAVHSFKAAWNAANPGNTVPIGTGNYEPSVSAALSSALGGQDVPPGCGSVSPLPAPAPSPSPSGGGVAAAASAALAALSADPNYCASVGQAGSSVNTAVHNFKAAWNAANPSNPVPIGTGKYEPVVASALASALGGQSVPAGCGGGVSPSPTPPPPPPPPPPPGVNPVPSPGGGGTVVVAPTQAGISTGAIVAGAVGAVALVGVIAAASMSGKGAAGHRGARGARGKRGGSRKHGKAAHKKKR